MTFKYDPNDLKIQGPLYYKYLFPFGMLSRWLSYGTKSRWSQREIAYVLPGNVYIRFDNFESKHDFRGRIESKNPEKINIGAVYNMRPSERSGGNLKFRAWEKELVFDIDISDYDECRTCCAGKGICKKCWKFMVVAGKILDAALRDDFGFRHILWIFSGRRGIHCWVCDEIVRKFSRRKRTAIATYISNMRLGRLKPRNFHLPTKQIHHSILRALQIAEEYFEEILLIDQDFLGTDERVTHFLQLFSRSDERPPIQEVIASKTTTKERWHAFVAYCDANSKSNLRKEIILHYIYPRLDFQVTAGKEHLLKCPFSIHADTGKICVPFNIDRIHEFDPDLSPNLAQLYREIRFMNRKGITKLTNPFKVTIEYIRRSSLCGVYFMFQQFVLRLEEDRKKAEMLLDTVEPMSI